MRQNKNRGYTIIYKAEKTDKNTVQLPYRLINLDAAAGPLNEAKTGNGNIKQVIRINMILFCNLFIFITIYLNCHAMSC